MPRVAIYCRVSTDKQSDEMQISELMRYCKDRSWTIEGVYRDVISGTKEKRPELDRLMAKAKARNFDIVLTWKLDRFARSLKHLVICLAELEALGVSFVSLKDSLDFTTPAGRFQAQVLGAVAEFEAGMIRERVKAGLARAREKGVKLGRKRIINRQNVFKMRSEGLSPGKIAKALKVSRTAIRKVLDAGPQEI